MKLPVVNTLLEAAESALAEAAAGPTGLHAEAHAGALRILRTPVDEPIAALSMPKSPFCCVVNVGHFEHP